MFSAIGDLLGRLAVGLGVVALLAPDVQVQFLVVLLGVFVDRADVVHLVLGQAVVKAWDRLPELDLASAQRKQNRRERLDRLGQPALARFQLAFDSRGVGLLDQQCLVQEPLLLDDLDEGNLVGVAGVGILDPFFAGATAQAHDLVHRRHALGAGVDAAEAVGAVVDPVRVLGKVVQPLLGLGVARVADEAVGLGQRRGADEVGVGFHREAGG